MRPSIEAQTFDDVVVTAHSLATQAGLDILAAGGNAVDAAIAANAVLGVCEPHTCGIGGDLFALIWKPGMQTPAALNASGRAGSGSDPATLRSAGVETIPWDHPLTVTVPGCVDGWLALAGDYGSMPIARVLSPAIEIAEKGFPTSTELAGALRRRDRSFRRQPSARTFYEDGEPRRGTRIIRRDLARTLRQISEGGRQAFYEGAPGAAISSATGSIITAGDLRRQQSEWIEPASIDVFGRTAWTIPPNSQGYLTLAAARVFEEVATTMDPEDPAYVHALIESYRSVAWERDDLVADPALAPLPAGRLLSTDRLVERSRLISDRAATWPDAAQVPGGTTYLCALDRTGLGISLIQSNYMGIGSGIAAVDQGFFLHNRGAGFNLIDGHPNELAPGKRPLHTLAPSLWTGKRELHLLLGTRGGHLQPQILLQVAANLLAAGDQPGLAQVRPRWSTDSLSGSSQVSVEARMTDRIRAELEERGHTVTVRGEFEAGWGPVSMITVDEHGLRTGAPDPRVDTTSVGVR